MADTEHGRLPGTATSVRDIPLSTHERVLGVDITINARRMYCEMHGINTSSGLSPDPEIHAVGANSSDLRAGSQARRYLAAWARRNLFTEDGEGSR